MKPVSDIVKSLPFPLSVGDPVDVAIRRLKDFGYSKTKTIAALIEIYSMAPRDAKTAVHFNEAWGERAADDEKFHDNLENLSNSLKVDE